MPLQNSHCVVVGYLAWVFGFLGAHRFYYGKQITGTIWFFTLGLFFVGWIIDFFLIPQMDKDADSKYVEGNASYSVAWVLLFFVGVLGVHRMYLGRWISGLIYLISFGLFGLGILYDLWTLNDQVDTENRLQA